MAEQKGVNSVVQITPQVKILEFCVEPRSKSEIMEMLGLTDKRHMTIKYIKPLIEQGSLQMTNPEHPNSSNQKYVVSKK